MSISPKMRKGRFFQGLEKRLAAAQDRLPAIGRTSQWPVTIAMVISTHSVSTKNMLLALNTIKGGTN